MRVVLVEDEYLSLVALEGTIKHFCPELEVVGTANSVQKALQVIQKLEPELVFLDIKLGDGTSFELLHQLKEKNFKVVFITAFNQYALQAFEYAAVHYLLKPINAKKLREVVERLKRITVKEYTINNNLSILENIFGESNKRLVINTKKEVLFLDIDDIFYFEASSNYTQVHTSQEKMILASKSLIFFEETLQNIPFIRAHSKYLVHPKHIKKYIKGRGGELILSNESAIPVSFRRKWDVLDQIKKYNPLFPD